MGLVPRKFVIVARAETASNTNDALMGHAGLFCRYVVFPL
jgi:hypothetical protein